MRWHAVETKILYIPAVILEWEITTIVVVIEKMLVSFVVSCKYVALCCPTSDTVCALDYKC